MSAHGRPAQKASIPCEILGNTLGITITLPSNNMSSRPANSACRRFPSLLLASKRCTANNQALNPLLNIILKDCALILHEEKKMGPYHHIYPLGSYTAVAMMRTTGRTSTNTLQFFLISQDRFSRMGVFHALGECVQTPDLATLACLMWTCTLHLPV